MASCGGAADRLPHGGSVAEHEHVASQREAAERLCSVDSSAQTEHDIMTTTRHGDTRMRACGRRVATSLLLPSSTDRSAQQFARYVRAERTTFATWHW